MKIYTLKKEQWVKRPHEEVFEFFKTPENLARLTPPSLGFRILTPSPVVMEKGRLIDYTIRVMGLSQRWTTLITDYHPPHRFVDEQLKGPYAYWHHTHFFEPSGGGTQITDEVKYALPWGFLGELVQTFYIEAELNRIFEFRQRAIQSIFS